MTSPTNPRKTTIVEAFEAKAEALEQKEQEEREREMIRLKLEKLAKANYRNTLKRQAFKKLQVHFVSRQADKEATEYYISKLLGRMIKNWRLTVNRMLQYKHDLLLERKKAYLRERLQQYT